MTDITVRPSSFDRIERSAAYGPAPITLRQYMEERTLPEPMSGCWLWFGPTYPNGYGCVSHEKREIGKSRMAHRISYEMHRGPIPQGLVIDHLCRNRGCVNPAHMECVTFRENCIRGVGLAKGHDFNRRKTHCPQGHPYDAENTYRRPDGSRACRECNREKCRRQNARRAIFNALV